MSAPSELGLYVLGSYEERVTIYSQQIRAFNLVFALRETGQLPGKVKVAVIGAGVAGITAAAAAAYLGAEVTIYERHSEILHNLRGCHTRHLHPNVYDWPAEAAINDRTALPFLNWQADTADNVARKLLAEWDELVEHHGIHIELSADITFHEHVGGLRRITQKGRVLGYDDFKIVILATGFGVETTIPPQPLRSYWRDDALHQPEIEIRSARTRYLVSGNGDGALIDILRLRLRNFRHETLLTDLCKKVDLDKVASQLVEAETHIQHQGTLTAGAGELILDRYKSLVIPERITETVKSLLREDTHVTFNFPLHPFTHRSSILNRFLVLILLKFDNAIAGYPGKLVSLAGQEPRIEATFETDNGTKSAIFDRVVIRHGPALAIARDFPACHARLGPVLKARNATDVTRRPTWGNSTYPRAPEDKTAKRSEAVNLNVTEFLVAARADPDARRIAGLRAQLKKGESDGLANLVALIGEEQLTALLRQLMAASASDEEILVEIRALLNAATFPAQVLGQCVNNLVTDAVFSESVRRKALVMALGPAALNHAELPALHSLFADVLRIVRNDQYTEVNLLVPPLVLAEDALPDDLAWEYVETLLRQADSASYNGAPAAQTALSKLSNALLDRIRDQITPTLLGRTELRMGLRILLGNPLARYEFADKGPMIDDFLNLGHKEFMKKHVPGYGEMDI